MNKIILILISLCFYSTGFAQKKEKSEVNKLLKEFAENGCKCVDSIDVYNKSNDDVALEIGRCIDRQTGAYQMGSKIMQVSNELIGDMKEEGGKKNINISIDMNNDSEEYKKYYYEIERYMVDNCPAVKEKIAQHEKQSPKSFSENPKALEWYSKGVEELKAEKIKKAIKYFENALNEDPIFAFAWDNLGLCYRKLEDYDNAIAAYQKSLDIDPRGEMPLQNIAVAYQYKGEFQNAIEAYKRLAELDKNNPEMQNIKNVCNFQ